jgi:NAD+ diphosphatase
VTAQNTFAGARLDRASERRNDTDWLQDLRTDSSSRALLVAPGGLYVNTDSDPPRPFFAPLATVESLLAEPVLLGLDGDGALFAVAADGDVDGAQPMELREAGALMTQEDGGLVAYAAAIVNWHRRHRFCANCGNATRAGEAGHVRECPRCGAIHHPRTDPVVIMLVHDGDRALLGRQRQWPEGRYSALAGFVEPGESLEEAVAREVLEESGVVVGEVLYRSSQPWPFPTSLMLGFHAAYASGDAAIGDRELQDVRWFSREELAEIAAGGTSFHLPPPLAIARRLIDEWLTGAPSR